MQLPPVWRTKESDDPLPESSTLRRFVVYDVNSSSILRLLLFNYFHHHAKADSRIRVGVLLCFIKSAFFKQIVPGSSKGGSFCSDHFRNISKSIEDSQFVRVITIHFYLVESTIRAGAKLGKPVCICGEMAGDTRMTRMLLGFGLRQFSMHPSHILTVKREVLQSDLPKLTSAVRPILRNQEMDKMEPLLQKLNL